MLYCIMQNIASCEKLQYYYEVLYARLKIREFFLKSIVSEVYENVGQALSLVHMQLSLSGTEGKEMESENAISLGNLLGQSIRDLRSMCRSFYPDTSIIKELGWADALEHTIQTLKFSKDSKAIVKGELKDIEPGLKLIVFRMLQETLIWIKSFQGEFASIRTEYLTDKVRSIIYYKGKPINFNEMNEFSETKMDTNHLDLPKKVKLIHGKLKVEKLKNGMNRIIMETPLNLSI